MPSITISSSEALRSCKPCDNFSVLMLERPAKLREITDTEAPLSRVTIPSAQCVGSESPVTLTRSLCRGSLSMIMPTDRTQDTLCVSVTLTSDCYFPEFGCGVDGLTTGPTKAFLCSSDILVTSTSLKLLMSGTVAMAGGVGFAAEVLPVPLPAATTS